MFYTEHIQPRLGDYDRTGRLSYEAILQILENVGSHHAAAVSDRVAGGGIAWVLVDWRIEITRRPALFQPLNVRTWARGKTSAAITERGFLITDDAGRELLRASAKLALVNLAAQKITRIDDALLQTYDPEAEAVFADEAPRLSEPESFDVSLPIPLRRSDIDFNGHVHNTRYIDFALEALPETDDPADDFTRLRIVYRSPVRPDSRPEIHRAAVDGGYRFCIVADGKTCTLLELCR